MARDKTNCARLLASTSKCFVLETLTGRAEGPEWDVDIATWWLHLWEGRNALLERARKGRWLDGGPAVATLNTPFDYVVQVEASSSDKVHRMILSCRYPPLPRPLPPAMRTL